MKFRVQARRLGSRVATAQPITITLHIKSLHVNAARPFGRRSFAEGLLEGVTRQLTRHIESIGLATGNHSGTVPVSVPPVSMPLQAGLSFSTGKKIGGSCARAVATELENEHAY